MPTAPSTSQHRNLAWVWIRVSDTADRRYWMGVALIGAALVVGGACSSPSRDGRAELCRGGRVIGTTHCRQIVGVGRPAVSPVHDVMNIEPAVVRATGHTAATISPFDDPSSSFRNRSLCSTDAERNAIPFPDGLNDWELGPPTGDSHVFVRSAERCTHLPRHPVGGSPETVTDTFAALDCFGNQVNQRRSLSIDDTTNFAHSGLEVNHN